MKNLDNNQLITRMSNIALEMNSLKKEFREIRNEVYKREFGIDVGDRFRFKGSKLKYQVEAFVASKSVKVKEIRDDFISDFSLIIPLNNKIIKLN